MPNQQSDHEKKTGIGRRKLKYGSHISGGRTATSCYDALLLFCAMAFGESTVIPATQSRCADEAAVELVEAINQEDPTENNFEVSWANSGGIPDALVDLGAKRSFELGDIYLDGDIEDIRFFDNRYVWIAIMKRLPSSDRCELIEIDHGPNDWD